ncbi:MAG: hypothetical protein ACK4UN_08160 [Limisphaerales bacterium]
MTTTKMNLQADRKVLKGRAFSQSERNLVVIELVHEIYERLINEEDRERLRLIRDWILVPYSLWPIDWCGLGHYVCGVLGAGKKLDRDMKTLLSYLTELPHRLVQKIVARAEHAVQKGKYNRYFRNHAKTLAVEKLLETDPEFKREWANLCKRFPVHLYARKGVIRRRQMQERNFRSKDWEFRWKTKQDKFTHLMDGLCYSKNLYGVEGTKPLPLRLSVNAGPFGTIIVIPRNISLDFCRDFIFKSLSELHQDPDRLRQGEKCSMARLERMRRARRAYLANEQAKRLGLKGEDRLRYVEKKLKMRPGTDDSTLGKLITEGRKLIEAELED